MELRRGEISGSRRSGVFGRVEEIRNGSGHVDGGNFRRCGVSLCLLRFAITNGLLEETVVEAVGVLYQQGRVADGETGFLGFEAGMDAL